MVFTKRLREAVRRGEITSSVRIWTRPHVKVGGRYRMDEGEIQIDSVEPIELSEVTPQLARESGFLGVSDLLKIARHGIGENIYLIRFHYLHSLLGPSTRARTRKDAGAETGTSAAMRKAGGRGHPVRRSLL